MVTSRVVGLRLVNRVRWAPQVGQKLRVQLSEEAYSRGVPASQRKLANGTVIQVVTMPPLQRLQIEQTQHRHQDARRQRRLRQVAQQRRQAEHRGQHQGGGE